MLQDPILRTKLCGSGCIPHPGWLIHFHPTKVVSCKYFVQIRYHLQKGTSAGLVVIFS